MITREVIPKNHLLELLRAEAKKFNICKTIYIGPIKEIPMDLDGCNWKLLISGGEEFDTKECVKLLEKLISSLRLQFNIPVAQ